MLRAAWMIFARTALAARSLETIHFGPEYCGRALSPEEGGEWGDGNERTGDEASSRRERSETADGRRNPGHGKGSGSRREDSLQARGGNNRARIHLALERVLFAALGKRELTSASPSYAAGEKTSSEVAFLRSCWRARWRQPSSDRRVNNEEQLHWDICCRAGPFFYMNCKDSRGVVRIYRTHTWEHRMAPRVVKLREREEPASQMV
jgi:hypothetical protein